MNESKWLCPGKRTKNLKTVKEGRNRNPIFEKFKKNSTPPLSSFFFYITESNLKEN